MLSPLLLVLVLVVVIFATRSMRDKGSMGAGTQRALIGLVVVCLCIVCYTAYLGHRPPGH